MARGSKLDWAEVVQMQRDLQVLAVRQNVEELQENIHSLQDQIIAFQETLARHQEAFMCHHKTKAAVEALQAIQQELEGLPLPNNSLLEVLREL